MSITTPTALEQIARKEAQHVLQNYKRNPIALVRGSGVHVYDADGRRYLDLLSGIGVASLGHGHEGLARALGEQAATLIHTSNLFFHPLQGELAERLSALSGLPRAFFCNSGTEAVEACLKFARRYWHTNGAPERTEFVAFTHGFSGRTMGSLSVTWDEHYRAPFQPLVPGVRFVAPDDVDAFRAAVTSKTAAIIVEPIQGEGGVRPIPQALVEAIEQVTRETGTLLIADEIQCGLGRTGVPFQFQAIGLTPDLVSIGKALGSGMPVAATLMSEATATAVKAGDHGTTYGGNLLACRAAIYFLEQLTDRGLLAHVNEVGRVMHDELHAIAARHKVVREVRGAGLIWGLDLHEDAGAVVPAALEQGVIVNRTSTTVIRMLPPYVITAAEVREGLSKLEAALTAIWGNQS